MSDMFGSGSSGSFGSSDSFGSSGSFDSFGSSGSFGSSDSFSSFNSFDSFGSSGSFGSSDPFGLSGNFDSLQLIYSPVYSGLSCNIYHQDSGTDAGNVTGTTDGFDLNKLLNVHNQTNFYHSRYGEDDASSSSLAPLLMGTLAGGMAGNMRGYDNTGKNSVSSEENQIFHSNRKANSAQSQKKQEEINDLRERMLKYGYYFSNGVRHIHTRESWEAMQKATAEANRRNRFIFRLIFRTIGSLLFFGGLCFTIHMLYMAYIRMLWTGQFYINMDALIGAGIFNLLTFVFFVVFWRMTR